MLHMCVWTGQQITRMHHVTHVYVDWTYITLHKSMISHIGVWTGIASFQTYASLRGTHFLIEGRVRMCELIAVVTHHSRDVLRDAHITM